MKNLIDLIKKIKGFSLKKDKKTDKKEEKNTIPKDILNKLPPGVKITKIEIGPKQIVKLIIWLILGYWVLSTLKQALVPESISNVSISEVITAVKKDEVAKIIVADNQILANLKDSDKILVASKETAISMTEILQKEGVDLSKFNLQIENRQGWKMIGEILSVVLTIGLPVLLILWLFKKQSGGAGGGMFGFGKSTAKLFIKGKQSLTFKDVAGVEEAKNDLVEVVDFLKHPEKYHKMGARAPKGVLLVGPSGVGKTLLAKAVAGEAGVPFYSMAGSEFMEMLVGVGASRVRDLFGTAKKAGKAIIFIDEIDAIGRIRGGMDGGHGEREQTLNQILVEMDGFEANTAVVVLAATNRGDLLDPALLRPGRFDRRVVLELPDLEARQEILKIHAKGKPFEEDVNWERVAKSTVGFSGAELENMLNEAAIGAARINKTKINMKDIDDASLKVKLGAEKRRSQTDEDKLMTAYHEAGHALVNYVEGLDPVSKISIISRGSALGFTLIPPQKDIIHYTKSKLIKQMAMVMGGRAAEEIIFGDITTGASSDISNATNMARNMVVEWGMSELGPINLGPQIDVGDWGKAYMEPAKISDNMQGKVDEEIKKFVDTAFTEAKKVITKNKIKLEKVAKALMEKESLNQEEFEEIVK
ncbi:MAG: ATP-dependent zinc metalloprotease FtsH [Candidatus Shapirobacteria bacterium]|nr:ATP-dependent zinc metalloprotease FtsH [Candidatus Shapirobacteria bacterium]